MENTWKLSCSKTSSQKNHEVEFFENFFRRKCSLAQLLVKTWYPYLFSILRNVSQKFEILAYVTKYGKKSHKPRSPKN